MTPAEYQTAALRTEVTPPFANNDMQLSRLLHGMIGVCTESGELQDAVKKLLIYGKSIDMVNVIEEVGDVLWYLALICDAAGGTIEQAMEKNINKLKVRFPDRFSYEQALNRDLVAERATLEGAICGSMQRDGEGSACMKPVNHTDLCSWDS